MAIGKLEGSIANNFDNAEEIVTYLKNCRNNPENWRSTSQDTQFLLPSEWMLKSMTAINKDEFIACGSLTLLGSPVFSARAAGLCPSATL